MGLALSSSLAACGGDEGARPAASSLPPAVTTFPAHARPDTFLAAQCPAAELDPGSRIGLAIARPTRIIAGPGPHANAYAGMLRCLHGLHGAGDAQWRPLLRTQLPIDALRRVPPDVHEAAELHAFAQLLVGSGADGIVSIRAHDFTRCGRAGQPAARERSELAAGEPLQRCEYPSPGLYRQLFGELRDALTAAAPDAELWWTAWNEPDHPSFTLSDALGTEGAARQAGRYWRQVADVTGVEHALAGGFADRTPQLLGRLRVAFLGGAGAGERPVRWAIHPYRDLTRGSEVSTDPSLAVPTASPTPAPGGPSSPVPTTPSNAAALPVTDAFTEQVAPAAVWLTEVTPLISSRRGLDGNAQAQREAGQRLRAHAEEEPTVATLYLLIPPPPPRARNEDGWDSALADRQGRARPFICGLAGLPAGACTGSPVAFGS